MKKTAASTFRRKTALSREIIIEAAIALLDSRGEEGLTFRSLAEHLATGAGAIYWYIENRDELLIAACDAIISRTVSQPLETAHPEAAIRAVASSMFDTIDERPWVGAALTRAAGKLPMVRVIEAIGGPLAALGVSNAKRWTVAAALLSYILGVAGQNAMNRQYATAHGLDRSTFLSDVSISWMELDADRFPFTRSVAAQLPDHDDKEDFLAGIDLIIAGLTIARNK